MTPLNVEVGISESLAQTAEAGRGNFTLTGGGGGGLSSLLPKVSTDKAWIVWLGLAVAVVAVVAVVLKLKKP